MTHDEFWAWFNRDQSQDQYLAKQTNRVTSTKIRHPSNTTGTDKHCDLIESSDEPNNKRVKTRDSRIRHIVETEAANRVDKRYVVLYGRHRPGRITKVWEEDGYLSLVNGIAHLCDLKGRMIEEPTLLDDVDLQLVEDQSDLLIGNTNIQIVDVVKNNDD